MELTISCENNCCYLNGFSTQPLDTKGIRLSASELLVHHSFGPNTQFYRHGWNSWSSSAWWFLDRQPWRVWNNPDRTSTAEDAATDSPDIHRSYLVTALSDGENCLLIGSLSTAQTTVFDLNSTSVFARPLSQVNSISAVTKTNISLEDKKTSLTDSLPTKSIEFFIAFGPEIDCWQNYSEALRNRVADQVGASTRKTAPATWSSWYSYFEEITEEIIQKEIPAAKELGYGSIQIDDGWEETIGTWEANHKFPSGMAMIAEQISKVGLVPGLWISPFIAGANSEIFCAHPEFFIHDTQGTPLPVGYNWGAHYYGLDCTHPGAQDWLHQLISKVYNWGFRYLKLDFLYAAAFAGHRYQDIDRETAYQLGLKIIRQAAPEAYLLGSGAVVAPSLGLLDGIRVGPDTAPYWDVSDRKLDPTGPGVRNALRSSMARTWLRAIIDPDPDVCLFRTRGSLLSPEANQATLQAARVCGVFSTSDPKDWLTDEECAKVKKANSDFATGPKNVKQIGRYRYRIGNEEIDFEPWINPSGRISDRLLVK